MELPNDAPLPAPRAATGARLAISGGVRPERAISGGQPLHERPGAIAHIQFERRRCQVIGRVVVTVRSRRQLVGGGLHLVRADLPKCVITVSTNTAAYLMPASEARSP